MDINPYPHNRSLSAQTYALRPYEDNCPDLAQVCEETGRKPGEVLRDLVDEALRARRNPQAAANFDEIAQKLDRLIEQARLAGERYEQYQERDAKLKQNLLATLRDFAGILGEILAAAIGARRLTWNYLAQNRLKQSQYTEDRIKQQWDAEKKAWNDERDATISEVKRIIRSKWPPQE